MDFFIAIVLLLIVWILETFYGGDTHSESGRFDLKKKK